MKVTIKEDDGDSQGENEQRDEDEEDKYSDVEEEEKKKTAEINSKIKTAKCMQNESEDSSKIVTKTDINPTATSSGISEGSSQQKLSRALKDRAIVAKQTPQESCTEEEDEIEDIASSPERDFTEEKTHTTTNTIERANTFKIQSIVPKDIEMKKELMSFIAYNLHLENTVKLITSSKAVNFSNDSNDKNRIYMSGTSIMSMKLTVSLAQSRKLCEQL